MYIKVFAVCRSSCTLLQQSSAQPHLKCHFHPNIDYLHICVLHQRSPRRWHNSPLLIGWPMPVSDGVNTFMKDLIRPEAAHWKDITSSWKIEVRIVVRLKKAPGLESYDFVLDTFRHFSNWTLQTALPELLSPSKALWRALAGAPLYATDTLSLRTNLEVTGL